MGAEFSKSIMTSLSKSPNAFSQSNNDQVMLESSKNVNIETQLTKTRRFHTIEKFVIVWLDSTINQLDEHCQNIITQLRSIINSVELFTDLDLCVDYITEIKVEKIFLIVSESIGEIIVPLIEQIAELDSIYVLCTNNYPHEQWDKKYKKVKGISIQIESICHTLKRDVNQYDNDLTLISVISSTSTNNLNDLDATFMYSQLIKEILLEFKYDEEAKNDLVTFWRHQYLYNNNQLNIIEDFERDYHRHSPIWWYTRELFTYSMINKALRTLDVEVITKMGFFMRDLHQEIKQLYSKLDKRQSFLTYRGQGISNVEFDKIKTNRGGLLSFNNFLSTSTDREVSFAFADSARDNPNLIGIFFHMEIDPSVAPTPFTSLNNISYYPAENEILFSMHTIFRIGNIDMIDDRLCQINLTLTSDHDEQLKHLTDYMREKAEGCPGLHQLGALTMEMGEFNKAEEIYMTLLSMTSHPYAKECAILYHQLGCIKDDQSDLTSALAYYKQALDIYLTFRSPNDSRLAATYSNIGMVLHKQGDLNGALEYYRHALNCVLHARKPDPEKIASGYNNIGEVLREQGNYSEATKSYERALEIRLHKLPSGHPSYATTYTNIGLVHHSKGDYLTALSYHQKAYVIQQKSLPPNHYLLAITHFNISNAFIGLLRYEEAIEHAEKALTIGCHTMSPNSTELRRIKQYVDELRQLSLT
jgi:tetratricopeptide (TPR) repeat protein